MACAAPWRRFAARSPKPRAPKSAHALMRTSKFDLLLLDVNLPGLSGLDFLKQIQNEAEASKAEAPHVIIITAHGSETTRSPGGKERRLRLSRKAFRSR